MKFNNWLTIFPALFFLAFGSFLLTSTIKLVNAESEQVKGSYSTLATGSVYNKNVYILIYNPVMSNGQKLTEYMGWANPDTLATQYINWLKATTQNKINYTVVLRNEIDDFTTFTDGTKYDQTTYLSCLYDNSTCFGGGHAMMDYTSTINSLDICSSFNSGSINELWMFGAPYMGWYESNQAGSNAFWTNGPVITGTSCSSPMSIMGFSYERGLSEMVEDMMHRTEGTMTRVYGSWQTNSFSHKWNTYSMNDAQSTAFNYSGCGNTHYPPNGTSDYDWSNNAYVSTYCDEFLDYPSSDIDTNNRRVLNCSEWGCTSLGYFAWWMQRLPSQNGIAPDNKYADWWKYIVEPLSVYDVLSFVPTNTPSPTFTPTLIPTVRPTNTATPAFTPTFTPTTRPTTIATNATPTLTNPITSTPTNSPTSIPGITGTITPTINPMITPMVDQYVTDNLVSEPEIVDMSEPKIVAEELEGSLVTNTKSDRNTKYLISFGLFTISGISLSVGTYFLIKFSKGFGLSF